MATKSLTLKISTPTEPILPGRGFYQLEEDALYVQVGLFNNERKFFSYLESDTVRFDLDRHGRVIFIELDKPRRQWPVDESLTLPEVAEPADIRWLNFREVITSPKLTTNKRRTLVRMVFTNEAPVKCYYLSENVLIEVDREGLLVSVWVDDIVDDLAGQEIAWFRKTLRKEVEV